MLTSEHQHQLHSGAGATVGNNNSNTIMTTTTTTTSNSRSGNNNSSSSSNNNNNKSYVLNIPRANSLDFSLSPSAASCGSGESSVHGQTIPETPLSSTDIPPPPSSEDNDGNGKISTGSRSTSKKDLSSNQHVVAGGDLVHRLLEQIALKDCPPSNFIGDQNSNMHSLMLPSSSSSSSSMSSVSGIGSVHHYRHKRFGSSSASLNSKRLEPLSELEPASIGNKSRFPQVQGHQKSQSRGSPTAVSTVDHRSILKQNLIKQGHANLAMLCKQALETVGLTQQIVVDQEEEERSVGIPSFVRTSTTKKVESHLKERKQVPSSLPLKWIKRQLKETSTSIVATDHFPQHLENKLAQVDKLSQTTSTSADETRENTKTQQEPIEIVMQAAPKLQMFGSEYARFISTTPLAPEEKFSNRLPTVKRPPRMASLRRRAGPVTSSESPLTSMAIEDANIAIKTGAITDIIVTVGDEAPPKGYYQVSQSFGGHPFAVYDQKHTLSLYVKKESNWDRAAQRPCVTALAIIFPHRNEFVPPGFSIVRHQATPSAGNLTSSATGSQGNSTEKKPANLNPGGTEPAYLCFRRSREGNPITSIIPLLPSKHEMVPEGHTVLERTPRNHVATFKITQNVPVFLSYRQRLANLEMLLPLPLVMSVHQDGKADKQLGAYYATGGAVVESRVGRFHIMDRSTHCLLSPSSINNRLTLIEASRQKTLDSIKNKIEHSRGGGGGGDKYSYSNSLSASRRNHSPSSTNDVTSSAMIAHYLASTGKRSNAPSGGSYRSMMMSDIDSIASSKLSSTTDTSILSHGYPHQTAAFDSSNHGSLHSRTDEELERCIKALNFIPSISTGMFDSNPSVVVLFQARVALLTPVLTSAYTRHGGSSIMAVDGLSVLLQAGFFADDIKMTRDSSAQTTLLDLAIQTVCDVATMGAEETQLYSCVEFVDLAVRYGCGYLSTRSIGYLVRFYLFVFHFGMSTPSGNYGLSKDTDHYFLEDVRTPKESVVPGGAPQLAALSMKDLIVFLVARLGSLVYLDEFELKRKTGPSSSQSSNPLSQVDRANYTELAIHQILKSGGSELFWYEMINACGSGLFGSDKVLRKETCHMYALSFALLANCIKGAMSKIRQNKNFESIPRDTASKLMSIEMIKHFLVTWERGMGSQNVAGSSSSTTFLFSIRRLVVPALLANTRDSLDDPRVYRRVIHVVGTLWCSTFYRRCMKLELGILFEHFVLRLLKLGPQILFKSADDKDMTYLFAQQLEVMKEIKNWFSGDPNGLIELFLNFDRDTYPDNHAKGMVSGVHWNICQQLCSSMCILAEKCTEFLGEQIRESQSMSPTNGSRHPRGYEGVSTITLARESARRLRQSALDAVSQIVQALAGATASSMGSTFTAVLEAWLCGEPVKIVQTYSSKEDKSSQARDEKEESRSLGRNVSTSSSSTSVFEYRQRLSAIKSRRVQAKTKISARHDEINKFESHSNVIDEQDKTLNNAQRREALGVGFHIAKEKGLTKAVDYLVACNLLTASPRDIVSFIRIHSTKLRSSDIGDFLGEGGVDSSETEYWNAIRYEFIRAISFVGMTVEQGLRHLLTQGGFRLPGEAQKIDRLLTAFAQCYWEDNAGDKQHCPFGDQDTIFTLSFAIILLNTDLHKAADVASTANKKRQKKKRMSKAEFMNNLRGVSKGCDIDREYLSSIFDSIEAQPIVFNRQDETETSESKVETDSDDLKKCIEGMSDNANSADALLRGLSTHEYRYISIQEHALSSSLQVDRLHAVHAVNSATLNIIREFFNKTWHQYHGLINSSLKIAHLDHKAMESCIDLLKFALFLTIVHDTPMERVAFLDQLGRFRKFNAYRTGTNHTSIKVEDQETFKNEGWYKCIAEISCDKSSIDHGNSQLNALKMLDDVVNGLGITIASDFVGKKILRDAVRQLENSEYLLNDPNRKFLRQGDLLKRSNKTGRFVEYRFFLFSDALVYAKKIVSFEGSSTPSKFRIHEELPLILMKVLDWFPPEMKKDTSQRAFQIYHPRKTFLVLCNTHDDRKSWVNDIRRAIDVELQHKVATAAARKAAATVPSVLPPPPVLQAPPQQKEKQQASHEKYNGSCASTSDSATIKTTNY